MLFKDLFASSALALEQYADIDHFRESERYVQAESIPLAAGVFSALRANLALPSCVLSLVRTFPRLINGYELSGRLVIVVPMNSVSSARVNGSEIGQSLLLLKGSANCTVYEPEGRLVAVVSIQQKALHNKWEDFGNGHVLLRLPPAKLINLHLLIRGMLEFAAHEPEAMRAQGVLETMNSDLFAALDDAMCLGGVYDAGCRSSLNRYKQIVDHVDRLTLLDPVADSNCEELAAKIGISVRTLQTAVHRVCGSGIHRYSRLRRLWSVRRQLRTGIPGLTVRSSALAHGFWHMGEFSNAYRAAFGELPSLTLAGARRMLA
jgi:AraC family ethanolamine operon transcriptional activator